MKRRRAFETAVIAVTFGAISLSGCGGVVPAPVMRQPASAAKSLIRQTTASQPQLLIAYSRNSNFVAIYEPGTPGMIGHIGPDHGIDGPVAAALDSNNDLFVANSNNNTVTEYAYPYNRPPIVKLYRLPYMRGLVPDAQQNLYVYSYRSVHKYAPPYTASPLALYISGGITGIAVDSSGDLFYSQKGGSILELSPPYTSSPRGIAQMGAIFDHAYMDPNNNLWSPTGSPGGTPGVEEFVPPYPSTPALTISTGSAQPSAITQDQNSTLFFVEKATPSRIAILSPPYTGTIRLCCTEAKFEAGLQPIAVNAKDAIFAVVPNTSAIGAVWEWTGNYSGAPHLVTADNANVSFDGVVLTR